ncbi:hypothetical protein HHL22_20625 [Hymenobacter sp. RP-2-7]|uniref:Uncharacterized protein n=1 Tax=Hymenobacter polaris TaxID=2682546 RepID=A0A7Y0AHS0_9BACT|nr:hypothetical protein [Hymenobacter polaris]NML67613.1 hypothetical protein [Hymenobacter polaris]
MALLSYPDIQQLLKSPRNGAALAACVNYEQRLRLHVDAEVNPAVQPAGMETLLALPKKVLPTEKYEKFCAFIPSPLPTVKITGKVKDGLSRVFEAQDGSVTVELATAELETDFETFRTAQAEADFWPGTAFEAMARALHSILVVDMATEQTTPRPEPYVFALDIASVVDVDIKADASCEYLAFWLPSRRTDTDEEVQRVAVYDDGYYRIFEKLSKDSEWPLEPVLENAHVLGYCPARMLWSDALGPATGLLRFGPLTNELGDLDRYVYWYASIEYFKTYGMFPPLWSVEEECAYEGPGGEKCHGGFIQVITGYDFPNGADAPGVARYREKPCPTCQANKYLGPGTHLKVPAPTKDTGDTRNPLAFVKVDIEALKDARLSLKEERQEIITSCLGSGGEPTTDQPRNEQDVRAGFENQQDVLLGLKRNFDKARTWTLTTQGKLRYGPLFRRAVVNSGEQFYLKTPTQLSQEEVEARKAGRPVFELSQYREMRYFTLYRNNPPLLDRMRILSDLEPYPEYSIEQITTMIAASLNQGGSYLLNIYAPEKLALKADFARYITRFESEQTDVRTFAALQPYYLKLQLITTILLSYVSLANTPKS